MAGPASTTRRNLKPARRHEPGREPAACKPYVSIAELACLTPWTDQAIRTMISRGILREGEHYFHVGRRPVFKWAAIVAFIEQGSPQPERLPHYRESGRNQSGRDQLSLWDESERSGVRPARSR